MTSFNMASLTTVNAGFKKAPAATDTRQKAADAIEAQKALIGKKTEGRKGSRSWVQLSPDGKLARVQVKYGSSTYLPSRDKTQFWEVQAKDVPALFDAVKVEVLAGKHDAAIAEARGARQRKPKVQPAPTKPAKAK